MQAFQNNVRPCCAGSLSFAVACSLTSPGVFAHLRPKGRQVTMAAIPSKQKAVVVDAFSPDQYLDHVQVVEKEVPEPGHGEALVQVTLRPINPTDLMAIKTGYSGAFKPPFTPGSDGVGKVLKLGPGASAFKEGQRVIAVGWPLYSKGQGSWQQYVAVPEKDLANPPTAYGLLKSIGAPKGSYVLQTAATSVVGRQIIALAKHWGLKTINVVRRESAVDELKALGADEVLVTDKDNIAERVKAITGGKGAHGAADAVGGTLTNDVLYTLGQDGMVFVYGVLSGKPLQIDPGALLNGNKGIKTFIMPNWLLSQDKQAVFTELFGLLEQKVLPVGKAAKKFPLDEVIEALKVAESSTGGNKVFLEG